ncbi:MAG TPA: hypothetical protein VGS07_21315 [Thermoanaerobaculia bacterium]|jgi:hypothetical protein|nr:hypothetical protein [Thermoanaerobaculia bacterium]
MSSVTIAPPTSSSRVRAGRNWFSFVSAWSEDARRWVLDYRHSECWELMMDTFRSLELLRERRTDEGLAVLEEVHVRIGKSPSLRPSLRCVVQRYYHPVLAYAHYCREELDLAEQCLGRAQDSVAAAIGLERFLLPLADICLDFGYQRARIARSRRRWREVRGRLDDVGAMLEGRAPFCRLPADGTGIMLDDLLAFYAAIPLDQEERASLADLLDPEVRSSTFQRTCAGIFALPDFVIPYP